MKKKSQSSFESLMNVIWAILIISLIIVVLMYMGILNLDRYLPDKVELPVGFIAKDMAVSDSYIQLYVHNAMGTNIHNMKIKAENCDNNAISTSIDIDDGDIGRILIPCDGPEKSSRFKTDLNITYTTFKFNALRQTTEDIGILISYVGDCSPINGEWGKWSNWGVCSENSQNRIRECNNPEPICGGDECEGESIETQECLVHDWGEFGCSIKCTGSTIDVEYGLVTYENCRKHCDSIANVGCAELKEIEQLGGKCSCHSESITEYNPQPADRCSSVVN